MISKIIAEMTCNKCLLTVLVRVEASDEGYYFAPYDEEIGEGWQSRHYSNEGSSKSIQIDVCPKCAPFDIYSEMDIDQFVEWASE